MTEIKTSFCRFCHAFCGIRVTVDEGRVTKVVGDVDNPMYRGFTCIKGRALPEQHNHPDRLLHSMKRMPDGSWEQISAERAMDEIAARLTDIIRESGPRSVAMYTGTFAFHYPAGAELGRAMMRAIGSNMRFSSGSIDQPGKGIARALHGMWGAGPQPFSESDTWLLVGANPTVSMWGGIPQYDPSRRLREAKARGMRLIVIDPRRTEAAANADLFLQPKPGEDPTILAGILRVILDERLHDDAFVTAEVDGLEALRVAVEPFTPAYVERRAGVPAAQVVDAARIFAAGRRGSVTAGTGPNMAPRGALTEYLIACIQTVCGRWMRAAEAVPNPFVLMPRRDFFARAEPPQAVSGYGEQLRVRGLGDNAGGLPTSALADEILLEGEGRVRALVSVGGNPMAAWPDQLKTYDAMQALDLNIALDIRMSATAKLCDYVIATKLSLETDAMTMPNETIWGYGAATTGYPEPYAQYAPKVVDPPDGADLIEEWELFYGLAQRMGLQLTVAGVELDMHAPPTTDALHARMTRSSRIPLDEVKQHPHGKIFDDPTIIVLPKPQDWPHRLHVGESSMMDELADVAAEPLIAHAGYADLDDGRREGRDVDDTVYGYRLVSRRMLSVYNSSGRDIPHLVRQFRYNPAFMHPDDLAAEGMAAGDVIEIESAHASILAVVEPAPDVRRGVISMAHAFGDAPKYDSDVRTIGSNTGRLSSTSSHYQPISGLPMMSAIPVNVRRSDENLILETLSAPTGAGR
jgi:anaerobic selenocysteine-containing dehydrogenase